ncbi:MAG: hypothetical protein K7J46_00890 [Bryobacter sp.]|jgi:hypothetical protein|nr:hypothetical protein [Bryobacter sp. CoA8 C33]
MASQNQIEANRQNAQASTGPKSPAGKLTVSRNALRHGLTANSIDQFPAHVQDAYLSFREELLADFQPASAHELHLFEQMAFARFLLLRAEALHITALENTLRQQDDPAVFAQLTRIQRYMRGLERSARETTAAFQQAYADRCAAVDLQDIVTHELNSPVVLPSSAPISRLLAPESYRVPAKDAALRLAYLGQHRLHAFEQADRLMNSSPELRRHE